jgi:hypothetical protein
MIFFSFFMNLSAIEFHYHVFFRIMKHTYKVLVIKEQMNSGPYFFIILQFLLCLCTLDNLTLTMVYSVYLIRPQYFFFNDDHKEFILT